MHERAAGKAERVHAERHGNNERAAREGYLGIAAVMVSSALPSNTPPEHTHPNTDQAAPVAEFLEAPKQAGPQHVDLQRAKQFIIG